MSPLRKLIGVVGVVVLMIVVYIGILGRGMGDAFLGFTNDRITEQWLMDTADGLKKRLSLPMMIDNETRLDFAKGGPGLKFTYFYTLINYTSTAADVAWIRQKLVPIARNTACSNKELKRWLKNNVVIAYYYRGNDGIFITEIKVSQSDCNSLR